MISGSMKYNECMSMILCMTTITDGNLALLRGGPQLILKVVSPNDYDAEETRTPEEADLTLSEERGEGKTWDLDKSWHAIHFMLTGSPNGGNPPLNFLLAEGGEIGKVEVGYGPARGLNSREVDDISKSLSPITTEKFMENYDSEKMSLENIYPEIWDRKKEEDSNRAYIRENFEQLKRYIQEASLRKLGLIIWLG